jgi:hypothetical protein
MIICYVISLKFSFWILASQDSVLTVKNGTELICLFCLKLELLTLYLSRIYLYLYQVTPDRYLLLTAKYTFTEMGASTSYLKNVYDWLQTHPHIVLAERLERLLLSARILNCINFVDYFQIL